MKTRIDQTNKNTQKRLHRRGRGRGTRGGYQPWHKVQDVPSLGRSIRLQGWKTGIRPVHLLSKLELYFFYSLECNEQVVDYNEQYPLNQTLTLEIASTYNIPHPAAKPHSLPEARCRYKDEEDEDCEEGTRKPITMTTDFYVTISDSGKIRHAAYALKPAAKIYGPHCGRTRRKLKIEAIYWKILGIPFRIITEEKINMVLARNVEAVHSYHNLDFFQSITQAMVKRVDEWLLPIVVDGKRSLSEACGESDKELSLPRGASLTIAKHLIASRQWALDWSKPFVPCRPIHFVFRECAE